MQPAPAHTIPNLLDQARQLHAFGQLTQAEHLYRKVLTLEPQNPIALNLLAALALQFGHPQAAADLLHTALTVQPDYPEAHNHLAIALAELGQLETAVESYHRALALNPSYPEAHYNLALLLAKSGQHESAISHFQQALALRPDYTKAHNDLASSLKATGNLQAALTHYRRATELRPDFAEAHYNLGIALAELHRPEEAITSYRIALRLKPAFAEALNNLAAALFATGQFDPALQACNQSLTLNPHQAATHNLRGLLLLKKHQYTLAAEALQTAISLEPTLAEAHHALAIAQRETDNLPAAIQSCQTAISLNPAAPAPYSTLALLLIQSGRSEEARILLTQTTNPGTPELRFILAALTGDPSITATPPSYITSVFDHYAPHFDTHLVQSLRYRGPQYLRHAIRSVAPDRIFDILDLGCGTGLCGVEFHPIAKSLTGIDLAPAMVERCRARGLYQQVQVSDLLTALRQSLSGFDLILAADVFIYVGDLDPTFAAVRAALRPDGLLAFTAESCNDPNFILQPTLRFAHSREYLRQLAHKHHFAEKYLDQQPLRTQSNQPVPAWIMVLQKS